MFNNHAFICSGGIHCKLDCRVFIAGNIIKHNRSSGDGGAIGLAYRNEGTLEGNVLIFNSAERYGGGILVYSECDVVISQNLITSNNSRIGGGLYSEVYNTLLIKNSIFWNNLSEDYNEITTDTTSTLLVEYSDIEGVLWPGEGNISIEPLFRDTINGDFHLMSTYCGDPYDSPCIDAGDPSLVDSLLDCDWGLGEIRSDMGAYGGGDSLQTGIIIQEDRIPTRFNLSQNYPNPFNSTTAIEYRLPISSNVKLVIYNLLGQRTETLINGRQTPGAHSVSWDASGMASGIYFYKLIAGDKVFNKRMVLLK